MAEATDIEQRKNSAATVNTRSADADAVPVSDKFNHTKVTGRFNQYTSGYWALALPALSARYVGRYALGLWNGAKETAKENEFTKKAYAGLVGSWMGFIMLLYAKRTWVDMKAMFSETLAYEFNKKPEEVGIRDFFKSDNAIVHRTLWNYIKRNAMRGGVSASFFARFVPWKRAQNPNADSVDLGVGAAGTYLVSDVIARKETFFERLQSFVDQKINHTDRIGEVITAADLVSLYSIHARDNDPKNVRTVRMDSPAWRNDQILFGRMAELMNQTYGNQSATETAKFTIPKLLYLLGHDLIQPQNMEQSLTYIEIANRYGMDAVKQVAKASKGGIELQSAAAQYPVTLTLPRQVAQETVAPPETKFTDQLGERRNMIKPAAPTGNFADKAQKNADNVVVPGVA